MSSPSFAVARRLRAGETVHAGWCMLGSPVVAETIAREGFPAVVLDAQHGLWDAASLIAGIGAVNHAQAAPMVRVPLDDVALVSRALDFGAEAIIAPMINTAADARHFAAAAKYPPLGERSWGPLRAMPMQAPHAAPVDYMRESNEGTLAFAMIESAEALANVDAIAATPGIDALFVGPFDLSTALSEGRAQDPQAPEVENAVDRICTAAKKAGKIPGIYCRDVDGALAMARRGFRFIVAGNDGTTLRTATAAQLKALKS
ncbi:MAG TPA: aldolase/citrate lyase family protein [Pseudolabrys sp.]|nr:aldolase/citrate lyase family protein [Pseudolabrys sp.]